MEKLNLGWLKRARYNKHLTVEQVAASIGKTRSAIWRYESGITDITVGTLCQLLQLYGGCNILRRGRACSSRMVVAQQYAVRIIIQGGFHHHPRIGGHLAERAL